MIADGVIEAKPAQTDETAMRLLRLLSIVSRRRWPKDADPAPAIGVPPPEEEGGCRHDRRLTRRRGDAEWSSGAAAQDGASQTRGR